jgi:hypothetical protein
MLQALILAAALVSTGVVQSAAPAPEFAPVQGVAAFYSEHCVRCHREGKAKGGFRLDELLAKATVEGLDDPWKRVLDQLSGREMPPPDEEKRPLPTDYETQIAWLRKELEKSELLTAAARPRAQRRLNRTEYHRTVSDLFGLPPRSAHPFPPDDKLHGFDTVAEGLNTSVVLLEQYLAAAHDLAVAVTKPHDPRPPERRVFRVVMNTKDAPTFRLFNPNALVHFGDPQKPWENRQWVGNSWGSDHQVHAPGLYTITLRGKPRGLDPDERVILRLDIHGRRVGTFDSGPPASDSADRPLLQTRLWLEPVRFYSESEAAFTFTYVNGNPFGTAVGETTDYYGSCWQTYVDFKARRFPELKPGTADAWMPSEPSDLPVRRIADVELEIAGPEVEAWPPVGFQRTYAEALKKEDLRAILTGLLPLAWRRPVSEEEIAGIESFASASAEPSGGFTARLQAAITRILVAPEFLFLVEAVPPGAPRGGYRLTNWELATRLAYFLTGTLPDPELRAAAARGELTDPTKLDAQVQRLLRDPRCVAALTDGFLSSWLHLDRLAGIMPEPKLFPNFGDDLKRSLAEEPKAFFAELLRENGRITDLLDARHTWANERLAMHYGLDRAAMRGSTLRRIELPNRQRGGLLGMAGLLTLTSEATRTSPVKRGIYVLENLFNRPPPPPPPNVGDLIPNTASAKSIREHLALHRQNAACAGCHNRIDPWGLALENFDAVGAWRTNELAWEDPSRLQARQAGTAPQAFTIDASFELPVLSEAAKQAKGIDAARAELLSRRADFARGFTEKLMIYALGRGLVISDYPHLEAATSALQNGDYRLHALIRAIVRSPAFQTR